MGDVGKTGQQSFWGRFGKVVRNRLAMRARARGHGPIQKATDIAEESLRLEEKAKQAEGKSDEQGKSQPSDAYKNGHQARTLLTMAGAILTDKTGEVKANAPEIGEALLPFPFNLLSKAFRWLRH